MCLGKRFYELPRWETTRWFWKPKKRVNEAPCELHNIHRDYKIHPVINMNMDNSKV